MRNLLFLFVLLVAPVFAGAAPWPGEPWRQATVLTGLDDDFGRNLSGAHWNPVTRTLWVAVNAPGKFLALVEDGAGSFRVGTIGGQRAEWSPGGDLESITHADLAEQAVLVLAEGEDVIRKFATDTSAVRLLQSWNIKPHVPTSGGAGSEGLAFVPDVWLSKGGFVDGAGNPRVSKRGMGGLMFVAHQNGGMIYAFDLDPASQGLDFVGRYRTSRTESSGLEFDRSSGKLWIWHNTGTNFLEVGDLTSAVLADGTRQFKALAEYDGPKTGNLEGFAMTPASAGEHWAFITDDDNQDGAALMWFRAFAPGAVAVSVRVSASADDAEERVSIGAVNLVSTDMELVQDTSVQVVGLRFANVQIPPGVRITKAHVQFATDETGSTATSVVIRGQAAASASAFLAKARNVSARPRTTAAVSWAPAPWLVIGEAGAGQRTPDLSTIVQEVIGAAGWKAGGPIVLLVTGQGRRTAEAFDGDKALAPLLHVEFEPL